MLQNTTISLSPTRMRRVILSPTFSSGSRVRLVNPFMAGIDMTWASLAPQKLAPAPSLSSVSVVDGPTGMSDNPVILLSVGCNDLTCKGEWPNSAPHLPARPVLHLELLPRPGPSPAPRQAPRGPGRPPLRPSAQLHARHRLRTAPELKVGRGLRPPGLRHPHVRRRPQRGE